MPEFAAVGMVVLVSLVLRGIAIFALVYFGARLAIRHERRVSS